MTSDQIKAQISIIDKALESKYTPTASAAKLRAKKIELEGLSKKLSEAEKIQQNSSSASKRITALITKNDIQQKVKKAKVDIDKLLKGLNGKVKEFNQNRSGTDLKKDASRTANKPGKHTSAAGKTYYENRAGHTDISPKDKLGKGGRLKSALNRDRKYTSEQEWEQSYKRKGEIKHYEKHLTGGVVGEKLNPDAKKYYDEYIDNFNRQPSAYKRQQFREITNANYAIGNSLEEKTPDALNRFEAMQAFLKDSRPKYTKHIGEGSNINVFGYETKNFTSCAGAGKEISRVRDFISENSKGAVFTTQSEALRNLAENVDDIFAAEKIVHDNGTITPEIFTEILDLIMMIGIYNYKAGMLCNTSFLDKHVVEIAKYFGDNE